MKKPMLDENGEQVTLCGKPVFTDDGMPPVPEVTLLPLLPAIPLVFPLVEGAEDVSL